MSILHTKNYKQFQVGTTSFDDYHQANRCLDGDTVNWDGSRCILQQRGNHRTLVGVLELNSKYLYGHTAKGNKIYLFHPFHSAYPPMRVGCSERDTSKNQIALVQFSEWAETIPRGNLVRLLGPVGKLEAEKLALQWLYGRPELSKVTFDLPIELTTRILCLTKNTINIDPEGCRDIDDLITLVPTDRGWQLYITIADVAEHIQEGSPGDYLAKERCQTLYQNGQAVLPMLPPSLSEDQLSLRAGQMRQGLALSCLWTGSDLRVQGFEEVSVINQNSYSYDNIYSAVDFPVTVLKEIASFLKGSETNDSHEWIEQLMLLYNLEGAKILLTAKSGILRTHKAAKADLLEAMDALHPDLRVVAFEAAQYEPTGINKVHATLGNKPYTHLTSPIRRYADLVNQRVLKAFVKGECTQPTLETVCTQLNTQQKKQKQHDRDLFFLEQLLSTPAATGTVEGIVVETTETKTKVYIAAWKRIIKVNPSIHPPGSQISVDYYADLKKVSWKDRIVFRV